MNIKKASNQLKFSKKMTAAQIVKSAKWQAAIKKQAERVEADADALKKAAEKKAAHGKRHVALVQKMDFTINTFNLTVSVLMIDDIVIYDDNAFKSLSKSKAERAERILDNKVSAFLGYDNLASVTTL